jgi:hypothetical protein
VKQAVKIIALSLASIALSGCAGSKYSDSGSGLCDSRIDQLGQDTYISDAPCVGNYDVRHAGIFCRRQGKEMIVDNLVRGRDGYVVFKCLSSEDAEYQRPSYKQVPDVRIEDAR